ncbi:hypothetical protein L0222_19720 [bacterium]|nr:hypothetical protein [bacterium]
MNHTSFLLRRALWANAVFSALSGLAFVIFAEPIHEWLQPEKEIALPSIGILLLLYAVSLARNATRPLINRTQVWCAIVLDLVWVTGSIALLILGLFGTPGNWIVSIIADIVLVFAILQIVGLRKAAISMFLIFFVQNAGWTAEEQPLLDIRNTYIQFQGFTPDLKEKGREILLKATKAHGLEAWKRHKTMEVKASDEWISAEFGWWKSTRQEFQSIAVLDTFTSRMELLDGSERGTVLGIQNWKAYRILPRSTLDHVRDKRIEFYLPTLQYFNELPFRILRAPVVAYAGPAKLGTQDYDLVFASWSEAPSPESDQYMLWIHPQTNYIEYIHYTVREGRPDVDGTMHFDDFRRIDGVLVPFIQTVTVGDPLGNRNPFPPNQFFHRLIISSCSFHSTLDPALIPFQDRKTGNDSKDTKLPLPASE